MEPKKIALLAGAVVVALVTALAARSMMLRSAAPTAMAAPANFAAQPMGAKVLVATRPLAVGTILDDTSFRYQPWPKDLIQGAYYVEGSANGGLQQLRGAVIRTAVSAGQPLTVGSVVQPGDRGFLAAALTPGMRAVTVQVSRFTAVAGFVFPGDHVDLTLTQTVAGGDGQPLKATETILRNVRVLATDQRTSSDNEKGQKEVRDFNAVTVEVSPRQAEKIQVAQVMGTLALVLRPIAETGSELEQAIAAGTINVPTNGDKRAEQAMVLKVGGRPGDDNTSFVTGGDVSRFARRSMPKQGPAAASGAPVGAMPAAVAAGTTAAAPAVVSGVRVARGNTVTIVPTGGK